MLTRLDHARANVRDLRRAVEWYTTVLGFEVESCWPPEELWSDRVRETAAVRIYSFARSAGHRIDGFGSDFVLSPLMNPDGTARVACFHLTPGEFVGEHEATVGQLFCVVDGEGWVSGNDGVRTHIAAQQAAHWEPGETHAAGSDSGLTAIVLEGNSFEVWAKPADDR